MYFCQRVSDVSGKYRVDRRDSCICELLRFSDIWHTLLDLGAETLERTTVNMLFAKFRTEAVRDGYSILGAFGDPMRPLLKVWRP